MREIEFSGDRTPNWHGIFFQIQVVTPLLFVLELHPRANSTKVVFDNSNTFAVSDQVVVLRDKIETNVIFLAENISMDFRDKKVFEINHDSLSEEDLFGTSEDLSRDIVRSFEINIWQYL